MQLEEPAGTTGGITRRQKFHEIDEDSTPPKLDDFAAEDLLTGPALTPSPQASYDALVDALDDVVS